MLSLMDEHGKRVSALRDMLAYYDDGRSRSFYCLAAALLPIETLYKAIDVAADNKSADAKDKAKALRATIGHHAEMDQIELTLK